jgi:ABC-type transport system involved in multi-copper enzyme maturation permease subunit
MFWGFEVEFIKGIRTKKLWAVIAVMILFYVPAIYFMKQSNIASEEEAVGIMVNYTTGMALFFLGILAIVFGTGAINKEIEDGTIRIALSKSVTRLGYFLGKFTAQGAVLFLALLLTSLVTALGFKWVGIGVGKLLKDVTLLNILLLLVMLEFIAMGYLISVFVRSSGTSLGVALAVFFIIYLVIPAYVDYRLYSTHQTSQPEDIQKVQEGYYTKYLFFSPVAQMKVIMDRTIREEMKTESYGGRTVERRTYEYVGIGRAVRDSLVNLFLMLLMTVVYLGIAGWRFLRMDLR